jgi:hypothetical protein
MQHKQICKHLNVGHGDRQVRTIVHANKIIAVNEHYVEVARSLDEDDERFVELFEKSTFEGSQAAALEMEKIAKQKTKQNQEVLLFCSLYVLVLADSKMLSWPNSPLLVLLQFVDPNILSKGEAGETPLHHLIDLAAPDDYSTHVNQLILAKQLIEHGANVNAVSIPHNCTPLHRACYAGVVTNLDFVELLLKEGADPNAQDPLGVTPLMYTTSFAPGAASFLLNWPSTDINATTRSGESFLAGVRKAIPYFSEKLTRLDNADHIQHQFLLQQWREIEVMLVKKGAL